VSEQLEESIETAPTTKVAAKKQQGTKYVVLVEDGGNWSVKQTVLAVSGRAAVAAYVKTLENVVGRYVAVPARSWQPIKVEVETQAKLTFS
jgi:hypothetical protein